MGYSHRKEVNLTDKYSFSVENAEVISENADSEFAIVSLDFFASGLNLHDLYISEDTLIKTKDTIKNCPLVWRLDEIKNDVYTHDKDEVPCGFVPETFEIKSRKLADGRTMLSAVAYVWKRYTGALLDFFKRDGNTKPVSVEMSVLNTGETREGKIELLDYKFIGITVLGSSVTPAIPLANANILSYGNITDEYNEALKREFFSDISMKIPERVKESAEKGLKLIREFNISSIPTAISFAKYISHNDDITPDKIRHMARHIPKNKAIYLDEEGSPIEEYVEWLLFGGADSLKWCEETFTALKTREIAYEKSENSGEKKSPDITTTREEKAMKNKEKQDGVEELDDNLETENFSEETETNTSSETTEEMAQDEKPVDGESEEDKIEMADKTEEEDMSADGDEDDKPEEDKTEMAEETEGEDKEEGDKEDGKPFSENTFQYPGNFSMEAMMSMFAEDEEEDIKMALEEMATDFCNPEIMMSALFTKMMKMAKKMETMAEESKSYMAENEELKAYKASIEEERKFARVQAFLVDLGDKVVVPEETMTEFSENSNNFSIEEIHVWEAECKAKSFDFVVRSSKKEETQRIALPFKTNSMRKPNNDIWRGAK